MKKKYQKLLASIILAFNLSQSPDLKQDIPVNKAIVSEVDVDEDEEKNVFKTVFKTVLAALPGIAYALMTLISTVMSGPLKYPVLALGALSLLFLGGWLLFKDNPMAAIVGACATGLAFYNSMSEKTLNKYQVIAYLVILVYFIIYSFISYKRLNKKEVIMVYDEE